jgi:hypothetical protein
MTGWLAPRAARSLPADEGRALPRGVRTVLGFTSLACRCPFMGCDRDTGNITPGRGYLPVFFIARPTPSVCEASSAEPKTLFGEG